MIIKQLSIFLEDKTGSLARVTGILAQHGINMSAFCVADATDYGILRMVVARPELASDILRNHNYSVHINDVVCLKLKDVSGSLNKALKVLSDNDICIDYMYAYASTDGVAISVMHSNDNNRMIEVLQNNKMELMPASEML
ncbi:MAG: ACT domain-containing protein [Muribaculaceae bacterium]|nr:ACT domain-containing protein [Muribaculaceae bacterium]